MGLFDKMKNIMSSNNDFTYLNELIHSGQKEIVLNEDIRLNENELSRFTRGIEIDVDNIVIDGNGFSIDAIGKTRIFYITGNNVIIKNMDFINGYAEEEGGAFIINSGSCAFKNCNFKNNSADGKGGVAFLTLASSSFEDCHFEDNSARYDGGTLLVYGGSCIVNNCFFNHNEAYAGAGIFNKGSLLLNRTQFFYNISRYAGGAVVNNVKSAKIIAHNCTFMDNFSGNQGGAIFNGLGEVSLKDCTLQRNSIGNPDLPFGEGGFNQILGNMGLANPSQGRSNVGGAIYNNASLKISNCKFLYNRAENGGAILNLNEGICIDSNSEFEGNKSSQLGGAIFNFGNFESNDSRFSQNSSLSAGAFAANQNSFSKISNAIFLDNEAPINNLGDMEIYGCEFRNNHGSSLPGSAITNGNRIKIERTQFLENNNEGNGGTIANTGKAELADLTFKENVANFASAIYNLGSGSLKISKSDFLSNNSRGHSAILNSGDMDLKESNFCNNSANQEAFDIFNENQMEIHESKFERAVNFEASSILNTGSLSIFQSEFMENNSKAIIWNEKEAFLSVLACQFKDNVSLKTSIFNCGESCTIDNPIFDNNFANEESCDNIHNDSILSLNNPIFKNSKHPKTILNNGTMDIRKLSNDEINANILNNGLINNLTYSPDVNSDENKVSDDLGIMDDGISNEGDVEEFDSSNDSGFESLDDLIHENSHNGEIILSKDYKLAGYEIDFYSGGIDLDVDNLIIDGKGHVIDGIDSSRIFCISGENITLKNIVFKNGNSRSVFDKNINGGGALRIVKGSSINLENCSFIDNSTNNNGGAIYNNGSLISTGSSFSDNVTSEYGAAIFNKGKMELIEDAFNDSKSKLGEDIFNEGELIINGLTINKEVEVESDAIMNNGTVIDKSSDSNLITHMGTQHVEPFNENDAKSIKDLFSEISSSDVIELENDFIFNEEFDHEFRDGIKVNHDLRIDGKGHTIDLKGLSSFFEIGPFNISLENITFKNSNSSKRPLFINNGALTFKYCRFNDNRQSLIENGNTLNISYCSFSKNSLKNDAIIHNHGFLAIDNSLFLNNSSHKSLIYNNGADAKLDLNNSLIMDNDIVSQSPILNNGGQAKIDRSGFRFNSSSKGGGAIVNCIFSSMIVDGCFFTDNNAEYGGAISNLGQMELFGSIFTKNAVKNNLGGAISNMGDLAIEKSIFSFNFAKNGASAINASGGRLNISGSFFHQNESKGNGVIYIFKDVDYYIDSCRIENNIPSDDIIRI